MHSTSSKTQTLVAAAAITLALARAAYAVASADHAAAILTYPYIVVDSANGKDTLLQLSTISTSSTTSIRCVFEDATSHCSNDPMQACTVSGDCSAGGSCAAGWQVSDFHIVLTHRQPTGWRASAGRSLGSLVPAVPEDPFVGSLLCVVTDDNNVPTNENVLRGEATLEHYRTTPSALLDVAKYRAIGLQAIPGALNNGDDRLVLGGPDAEYEGAPAVLVLSHFFDDALEPVTQASQITTTLVLWPCMQDPFLQQAPGHTIAQFAVSNEFEQRYSTSTEVNGLFVRQLSLIDPQPPSSLSIFNVAFEGTLAGQTRIAAVPSGVLAVAVEEHRDLSDASRITSAALSLHEQGTRAAPDVIGAAICGNGIVEAGEQCDDGNTTNGDCCSAACQYESSGSPCSDGDACTTADSCDGAGACVGGSAVVCDACQICNPASGCSGVVCTATPTVSPTPTPTSAPTNTDAPTAVPTLSPEPTPACQVVIDESVAKDDNCDGIADGPFLDSMTQNLTQCVTYQICVSNPGTEDTNIDVNTSSPPMPILHLGTVAAGATVCFLIPTDAPLSTCGSVMCLCPAPGTTVATATLTGTCAASGDDPCTRPGSKCSDTASINCETNTPTGTSTPTPTPTPTSAPTWTPTATLTVTPTPTPSNTAMGSPSSTPTVTPTKTPTNTPTVTPSDTPTGIPTAAPTDAIGPTPTVAGVAVDLGTAVTRPGGVACLPGTLSTAGVPVVATSTDIGFDPALFTMNGCTINPSIGSGTSADKQLSEAMVAGVHRVGVYGFTLSPIPDGLLYACTVGVASSTGAGTYLLANTPGAADTSGNDLTGVSGASGQVLVTTCTGDCDGNGEVTIGEVIKCVNLFLGWPLCDAANPTRSCPVADADLNGMVSIGEVIQCVNRFLNGC